MTDEDSEIQPIRSGTTGESTTLDSVVTSDHEGVKTHTFFFKTGEGQQAFVLGLSRQGETPEDAADGLCRMLQGLMIELNMKYPKVSKPDK